MTSISELSKAQEQSAARILEQPYFGKTVTGFGNLNAWPEVLDSITEGPKPNFRRPRYGTNDHPFVVRLGSSGKYEYHDTRDKKQSKFRAIKADLPEGRRLPPHQSTTYYEPQSILFKPKSFRPTSGKSDEIVGLRFAANQVLINRIILTDTGTYTRFYAFQTKYEAQCFISHLNSVDRWARSLEELKKKQETSRYNECMVRASWNCAEYSSQVIIYTDNIESRIVAIMRAMDIDDRLRSNPVLYSQAPYHWSPEYRVPISFWGNVASGWLGLRKLASELMTGNSFYGDSGKLRIYSWDEQKKDLLANINLAFKKAREYGNFKFAEFLIRNGAKPRFYLEREIFNVSKNHKKIAVLIAINNLSYLSFENNSFNIIKDFLYHQIDTGKIYYLRNLISAIDNINTINNLNPALIHSDKFEQYYKKFSKGKLLQDIGKFTRSVVAFIILALAQIFLGLNIYLFAAIILTQIFSSLMMSYYGLVLQNQLRDTREAIASHDVATPSKTLSVPTTSLATSTPSTPRSLMVLSYRLPGAIHNIPAEDEYLDDSQDPEYVPPASAASAGPAG